jgi:hypothetical protein
LLARGHAYDWQRTGGVEIQLHSHLPIDQQTTAMGETWLDRRLIKADGRIAHSGFGATVNNALRERANFLVELGFAQRDGNHIKVRSDLLTALRQRDLEAVAKTLGGEAGKVYRPLVDVGRSTGVYRRMVLTVSGRFAMLDDGLGFSLVPWRPVLEQRICQQLTATFRGDQVTFTLGRPRNVSR